MIELFFRVSSKRQKDEGFSLEAQSSLVKEHVIKNIVFDKIDRTCRGHKSAYLLEELMNEFDIKLHFTRNNLLVDKKSPMSIKDRLGIGI
ncbi:MAG: hypothetical protein N4A33_05875 [Bacteriovoracaceae bacterium]|jgi:DNA invertase Pin-like site-specific DNA recombinase|nr:hypothetical protein [Bacteriovoracaceae bacterium]